MTSQIKSAVLLAAGLGTRLRPLTLTVPKPLLPLEGILLIDHQLAYLAKHGIDKVVINLHYLGDMIKKHVGNGSRLGLDVTYSEEPEILGTGGGVKKASSFLGEGPFVVLNSDTLINVDIADLIIKHEKSDAAATMVLRKIGREDDYTPIEIDEKKHITGFKKGFYHYAGLQVVDAQLLNILPQANVNSCLINDGYKKILAAGGFINSYLYEGYFNDLGTLARYDQAKKDIGSGKFELLKTR